MAIKQIEELDEELCKYCPLPDELKGIHPTPSRYIACEGRKCNNAYERYLEHCVDCEVCGESFHEDECEKFVNRSDGYIYWLCEKCLEEGDKYDK